MPPIVRSTVGAAARTTALTAASLIIAGCSGGGAVSPAVALDGGSDDGTDAGAEACAATAGARCARLSQCSNGARITRDYGDLATCVSRLSANCFLLLAAPDTGQTPERLSACAAAYPAQSCADALLANAPAVCVAVGPRPVGDACLFAGQCASQYCAVPTGAACGSCAPPPIAGDACDALALGCGRDLTCARTPLTCVSPSTDGQPCNRANPCAPDLSCVATAGGSSTCIAAAATVGAACASSGKLTADCDPDLGLHCDGAHCTAIAYAAGGQPCGALSDGSFAACAGGGSCVLVAGTQAGACKAAADDGSACDTRIGPPCLLPARCILGDPNGTAGTCQWVDPRMCK